MRQQNDALELEETHILEFNQFNQNWDSRMNEFQQHGISMIKGLEEKHSADLQDYSHQLEETIPNNFKPSAELLNLRKIQFNLAKQKEYAEAHNVQVKCNKIEKREVHQYTQTRDRKKQSCEQQMLHQQDNEMAALSKRIEAGENEQKKQRAIELERMFLRYQNVKKELENKHKLEIHRMSKGGEFNAQASIMASRVQSRKSNRSKMSARHH